MFIPEGFAASGPVFAGQLHQRRASPLILLGASQDGYAVTVGSGLRALAARIVRRETLLGAGAYGRWHDIVIEVRFARADGGFIRIRADGALRFEAVGPTVATEPYFKIGLYGRADRMTGPLAIYFTDPVLTVE